MTAGYLRKIGPLTLSAFERRIIDIHPALLPRHGGPGMYGDRVHQAVLASGDAISGPPVHRVAAEYDAGAVIARSEVAVRPSGTSVPTTSATYTLWGGVETTTDTSGSTTRTVTREYDGAGRPSGRTLVVRPSRAVSLCSPAS